MSAAANLDVLSTMRPLQAMATAALFKHKRVMLVLPRQYGGKTETGVRLLRDLTGRPFSKTSIFLAKDKKSARRATREKFIRLFEKELFAVNSENFYLKAYPTSAGYIESVDKEPDKIRGGTFSLIHWSEIAFSKIQQGFTIDDVWQKVLQPTLSQTDGYALIETTLNGKNQFYDLWLDAPKRDFHRIRVPFWMMVEMGLISEEQYLKEKKLYSPLEFQQEFECEFVSFAGRAYPESDLCIKPVEPPMPHERVLYAIDWGYSPSATCVLLAYKRDGKVKIFKEIYAHNQRSNETAIDLKSVLEAYGIMNALGVADHEQDRNDTLNDEMSASGISTSSAQKTNLFGTRMLLKNKFHQEVIEIDPEGCPNLCRELEIAEWDNKKDGDIDYAKDSKGHFDAEAALRYLIREFFDIDERYDEDEDDMLIEIPGEAARREALIQQRLLFPEEV